MPKKEKEVMTVKKEACTRHLRVPLTKEEFEDRATQLAQALAEKQAAEAELTSVKSSYKATVDGCQARIEKYQQQVSERSEWRDVPCTKYICYESGTVQFINDETGEVFETRPIRPSEMQAELPLEGGK